MHHDLETLLTLPTLELAPAILGAELHTECDGTRSSGIIVEVEAYLDSDDPAAHSASGKRKRNASMFLPAGYSYVYLIYGLHHCVNIVTEVEGRGAAILIRALEPSAGIDAMRQRRACSSDYNLTSGPGKLCQALSIDRSLDGESLLTSSQIFLAPGHAFNDSEIERSPRVGIRKAVEKPWRFYVRNSPWLSRS